MQSCLFQKQSRPTRDLEICWSRVSRSKSLESPHSISTIEIRSHSHWASFGIKKVLESQDPEFDPPVYLLNASLMRLVFWTRPYIFFGVSSLSKLFSNPSRRHWTLARKVVSYLKTSQASVLFLSSEQGGPLNISPTLNAAEKLITAALHWQRFGCLWKYKKRSRDYIFLCNLLIYWKPKKQNHVSRCEQRLRFILLLTKSQKLSSFKMLSDLPKKLKKWFSTASASSIESNAQTRTWNCEDSNPFNPSIDFQFLISRKFLIRRNIKHPKTSPEDSR